MFQGVLVIFVAVLGVFMSTAVFSKQNVTIPTEQELYEKCASERQMYPNIWNTPAQREAAIKK